MQSRLSRMQTAIAQCVLCLLLLTSCSTNQKKARPTSPGDRERAYPPGAWLRDCPAPQYVSGQSWADLAQYTRALQDADDCNRCDKARLRAWSVQLPPPACGSEK